VEWHSSFDSSFDTFWDELKRHNPLVLLPVRTKDVLTWHFKYGLDQNRIWILTATAGARLLAYSVFERRDTSKGVTRLLLVDFQTMENSPALCSAMIACARERCRREGIHVLENPGCWIEGPNLLNRHTLYHRNLSCWMYWYKALNQELREALQNATSWQPTQYDGDASL
jgi:hypothetical protein